MERKRRILIAPLDWGLGHATRCVPLIKALIRHSAEVIVAASGSSAELLKQEFPNLKHYSLPGYNPVYPGNDRMVCNMGIQLPHFIKTIYAEHAALDLILQKEKADVVVSDNRYGCYSKNVKSIFISHQLHILMPDSFKWMESYVNWFNKRQVSHYNACWIPAVDRTLLGNLLPKELPENTRFIGSLSRLEPVASNSKYDVVAVLSGPDPQRSLLATTLRQQIIDSGLKTFLVHGNVAGGNEIRETGNLTEADYLSADGLSAVIAAGNIIVSRSGYSTIMDLARLGKKAVFIPTPGQTEQAYLAAQLMRSGVAYSIPQQEFNLKNALKESDKFSGFANFEHDNSLLEKAIQSIL